MGKSRPYITTTSACSPWPAEDQGPFAKRGIVYGPGQNPSGLKGPKDRIDELAKRVVKEGMPVRKVEALVAKMNERGQKQKEKNAGKSAFVRASESQLAAKFGSPVSITENKTGKGHLSIDFASPDELNRILDLLGVNLDD